MLRINQALLAGLALFMAVSLQAQADVWLWAASAGGTNSDMAIGMAVDTWGNSYVTGQFYDTSYFGATVLVSQGSSDIFVAKMDRHGNWLWAVRAGAPYHPSANYNDMGYDIAVDAAGNAYVCGGCSPNSSFGAHIVDADPDNRFFIAKISSEGNWLWAQRAGGYSGVFTHGCCVAVDGSGNVCLSGVFYSQGQFGDETLVSDGLFSLFLAKLSNSGEWLWAEMAGPVNSNGVMDVSADGQGSIYISGTYNGTAVFGEHSISCGYSSNAFLAKADSGGTWLWVQSAGGTSGTTAPHCLAVDADGAVYMSGSFKGNTIFPWGSVTGTSYTDTFVARIDSTGTWDWLQYTTGLGNDNSYGVDVDEAGNVYVCGYISGNVSFGSTTLHSVGGYDIYVAKLDPTGNWLWAKRAGGTSSSVYDWAMAVNADPYGNAICAGIFWDAADFGGSQLTGAGNYDIFVAKTGWVKPKEPANLELYRDGDDLVLVWDPVLQSTDNQPLSVDGYYVYLNSTNDIDDYFYYLGSTTDTWFIHEDALMPFDQAFYLVLAHKE